MNNKLILNALDWLIWNTDAKDEMQEKIKGSIGQEIDRVLYPETEESACDMKGCNQLYDLNSKVCGKDGFCEVCVKRGNPVQEKSK